jgi:hypothetical protein
MKMNSIKEDVGAINSHFNVDALFRLRKMAFVVEIALANARRDDSKIRIR